MTFGRAIVLGAAGALAGSCGAHHGVPTPPAAGPPMPAPEIVMDDDQPPRALRLVKPVYPEKAFEQKVEGVVQFQRSSG
jgi:hypothetical protein